MWFLTLAVLCAAAILGVLVALVIRDGRRRG